MSRAASISGFCTMSGGAMRKVPPSTGISSVDLTLYALVPFDVRNLAAPG
jgi:hypothetical protein